MADESVRVTVMVKPKTVARLREIATGYGLVATAGSMAGQGSISGLLDGIGEGRFVVDPLVIVTPEEMRAGVVDTYGARVAELWDMLREAVRQATAREGRQLALPFTGDDDTTPIHVVPSAHIVPDEDQGGRPAGDQLRGGKLSRTGKNDGGHGLRCAGRHAGITRHHSINHAKREYT